MRVYDIDGVITAGIKPIQPCAIVSGRLVGQWPEVRKLLEELGISPDIPVYLRPSGVADDRINAAEWKRFMCLKLVAIELWEDDPLVIDYLKIRLPYLNIIQVG